MTDTVRALYDAEQLWADALAQVGPAALDRPSGCGEWTNRDLINHTIGGGHRYAMLLAGASAADTVATRGTDYIVDDPVGEFWTYETMLREAAGDADLDELVDHRAGPRPGHQLLTMRAMELTLHTHDLAVGIGIEWVPSDALADYVLTEATPILEEFRAMGMIGPAVEPASSSAEDRLLAIAGRARRRR